MKTAIIIGATGLVGKHLVRALVADPDYSTVKLFLRRDMQLTSPKLEQHIVDFDAIADWQQLLTGDVLFSCLGTTKKQAGSISAQYKVDYSYQYCIAEAAANNGVKNYLLVSSASANATATSAYLRMKGELERDCEALAFEKIIILQPFVLLGERSEKRPLEELGGAFFKGITGLGILNKYRPISGATVAKALQRAAKNTGNSRLQRHSLNQVHSLAGE